MLLLICLTLKGAIIVIPTPPIQPSQPSEGGIGEQGKFLNVAKSKSKYRLIRKQDAEILAIIRAFLMTQN